MSIRGTKILQRSRIHTNHKRVTKLYSNIFHWLLQHNKTPQLRDLRFPEQCSRELDSSVILRSVTRSIVTDISQDLVAFFFFISSFFYLLVPVTILGILGLSLWRNHDRPKREKLFSIYVSSNSRKFEYSTKSTYKLISPIVLRSVMFVCKGHVL